MAWFFSKFGQTALGILGTLEEHRRPGGRGVEVLTEVPRAVPQGVSWHMLIPHPATAPSLCSGVRGTLAAPPVLWLRTPGLGCRGHVASQWPRPSATFGPAAPPARAHRSQSTCRLHWAECLLPGEPCLLPLGPWTQSKDKDKGQSSAGRSGSAESLPFKVQREINTDAGPQGSPCILPASPPSELPIRQVVTIGWLGPPIPGHLQVGEARDQLPP